MCVGVPMVTPDGGGVACRWYLGGGGSVVWWWWWDGGKPMGVLALLDIDPGGTDLW